ncbi:deoxynucleoside kinase [Congregibacter litoralis]|uniref:Deoxynucleoside kinase n=1 Tax=Congregibacter litoralis KT71 TaxID=314285 RepID=A4A9Z9_9GAMM|nr:deoxynucleoside kinase [Congregibacter litoralis]EAQ97316.1 Deoxynucleoside kinase [Congregibacter litoralis KT71]
MTTLDLRGRKPPAYIAVEGPIGVGKTTLTRRLAETFNHEILLEDAEQNPFLERFYRNRSEAALATQLFFLFQRAQKMQELRQSELFSPVRVADFLIEKDPLFARINLDSDEFELYEKVYQKLTIDAPRPDLVIYLQAPTDVLLERIENRGIGHEKSIDSRYLEQLNEVYSEFFLYYDGAPLLIVNASMIDLAQGDSDYLQLVDYLLDIRSGRHYFNPTFFG